MLAGTSAQSSSCATKRIGRSSTRQQRDVGKGRMLQQVSLLVCSTQLRPETAASVVAVCNDVQTPPPCSRLRFDASKCTRQICSRRPDFLGTPLQASPPSKGFLLSAMTGPQLDAKERRRQCKRYTHAGKSTFISVFRDCGILLAMTGNKWV